MIDDAVRLSNLPQCLAFMAFLPARRLVRWFAQAAHPRRLVQSIAGRRLTAVAAVQAEPALQLGDTGLQNCNLGRLRPDQRNQLFPRRLRLRIAIHESLNRNAIPLSRKNLPARHPKNACPTWAVTLKAGMSQREMPSQWSCQR